MSFNINNIGVNEINFNGNEVNSLYVNNTLVWERYGWVGWKKATWSDIYDLCLAVRNTGMKWPSDIQTGIYKMVRLDENFLGSVEKACYLVGIDIDGPGTLTFQTEVFSTPVQFSTDDDDSGYWGYGISNLKTVINSFENYASAINPYVIPLEKVYYGAEKGFAGYTMRFDYSRGYSVKCKYWAPSIDEMGYVGGYEYAPYNDYRTENEFTVGVTSPYQHLTTPEGRKKIFGYWTRSIGEGPSTVNGWGLHVAYVSEDYGSIGAAAQSASGHISICFTIGYFE